MSLCKAKNYCHRAAAQSLATNQFSRERRLWVYCVLVTLSTFTLLSEPLYASKPTLTVDDIRSPGMQLTFTSDCEEAYPVPTGVGEFDQNESNNRQFTFYLDPDVHQAKFGGVFIYSVFLKESLKPVERQWIHCTVKISSVGSFTDQLQDITYQVSHDTATDKGHFPGMPVHCNDNPNLISVVPEPSVPTINLADSDGLKITITNLSQTLGVTVSGTVRLEDAQEAYWETSEIAIINNGDNIHLEPKGVVRAALHLRPKRMPALLLTLRSFRGDESHAQITARFSYNSDKGGVVHSAPIGLKIRFAPSLLNLLIVLLAGSLLGSTAGQFAPNMWKGWANFSNRLARGLLFSLSAELVGMLLVGLGSKLVLLTFELDPWQLLPVGIIGLVVSGGSELISATGIVLKQEKTS